MALLQTAVLFCPFSCPAKGGFYGYNEAGPGDVLHGRTGCSDERFLAHSEFIRSFSLDVCCLESGWHAGGPLRCAALRWSPGVQVLPSLGNSAVDLFFLLATSQELG